jgi:hypothetical protein
MTGLGSFGSGRGPGAESSEHANELSDERKDWGFLNELRN